jgi:hypothetical protein
MYKCKYCGAEFETHNSLKGHLSTCNARRNYVLSKLTENDLRRWFEVEKLSAHFISKNILGGDISAGRIINECKKYNIKTWNIKESNNLDTTKSKRKQTCLEIYGAENCLSKGTKSYKKRNRTVKNKYGVGNVFELDSVKDKIKETCLEKYGVENFVQSDGYAQYRNVGNISYPHKQIRKQNEQVSKASHC